MGEALGHACHSACPCNNTQEEVIEMTTPLPPVVVWCTKCGGPKPCACGS